MSHDTSVYHASNMRRFIDFVPYVSHVTIFYEQTNLDSIKFSIPYYP